MLSNVLLWIVYGIVGVLAVEFLLIRRELKKIYYRSISHRETLDRSLAEVRNKGEEIIKKIGENTIRLKDAEDKAAELKRGILEEDMALKARLSFIETKIDTIDARLMSLSEGVSEMVSRLSDVERIIESVENRVVSNGELLEKSLAEVKGDVHSEACRLEGKIADIGKGVTETRYNDFLNYSLRLVEEAKAKACIEENLYKTLLELFHNLKVDYYLK